jgi:hypothetical protein
MILFSLPYRNRDESCRDFFGMLNEPRGFSKLPEGQTSIQIGE